ncbi:unnamed protein product [Caretta caretta]
MPAMRRACLLHPSQEERGRVGVDLPAFSQKLKEEAEDGYDMQLRGNSIKTVDLLYIYVLYVRVKLDPLGDDLPLVTMLFKETISFNREIGHSKEPQVGYRGSHTRAGPGYWSADRANRFDCKPQSFVEW